MKDCYPKIDINSCLRGDVRTIDVRFLQSRRLSVDEICARFNVPLHLVATAAVVEGVK
jgi:hypothetical protein